MKFGGVFMATYADTADTLLWSVHGDDKYLCSTQVTNALRNHLETFLKYKQGLNTITPNTIIATSG